MPKSLGIDSAIIFSNLPDFFVTLNLKFFAVFKLEETMEQKPSNGETNSQLNLNFLKTLVHILTIVMTLGMIIIVFIIIKEFFLDPKNKNDKFKLPELIKIPKSSNLESIDLKNNNISMVVTLDDGTQKLIIITFDNGLETSRKYIDIDKKVIKNLRHHFMLKNDIFINQLKEKLSIVDIIGKKVTWDNKKTNVNNGIYWSCCPFHNEKTASFKVDQNRGLFYCFGCHEKGDTISFTMKKENIDFLAAIEKLATEIGLKIPDDFGSKNVNNNISKSYSKILEIQEIALLYFTNCLRDTPSSKASLFIKNRISSEKIINNFKLGYATEKNKAIYDLLLKKGYKEDIIVKSGLCAKNDRGDIYDRFRDRIIFPIFNSTNKVVGFGGRALNSSASAKYLNSPETEVFQKGKLLFNENNCQKTLKIKI